VRAPVLCSHFRIKHDREPAAPADPPNSTVALVAADNQRERRYVPAKDFATPDHSRGLRLIYGPESVSFDFFNGGRPDQEPPADGCSHARNGEAVVVLVYGATYYPFCFQTNSSRRSEPFN